MKTLMSNKPSEEQEFQPLKRIDISQRQSFLEESYRSLRLLAGMFNQLFSMPVAACVIVISAFFGWAPWYIAALAIIVGITGQTVLGRNSGEGKGFVNLGVTIAILVFCRLFLHS